jgi:uncharacterized protein
MADQPNNLTCPKCESPMRNYERNGIVIDQCTGCRGVFLDRGELERLVDAEGTYYGEDDPRSDSRNDPRQEREREEHRGAPPKKKKKREFLSDFLDFG